MSNHPHQPYFPILHYHDPQRPIPYRGHPTHPSFSSYSSFQTHGSGASQQTEAELDPAAGGWDAPGPLLQERARRGSRVNPRVRQRSTDNWVRNPAHPPYGVAPRVPIGQEVANAENIGFRLSNVIIGEIPLGQTPTENAPERLDPGAIASAEVPLEPVAVNEEVSEEEANPFIGEDGWPAPTSLSPASLGDAPEATLVPSSSDTSSVEVVVDPISNAASPLRSSNDLRLESSAPASPPTFMPVHHYQPPVHDPNVLHVVNPRPWGVDFQLSDSSVASAAPGPATGSRSASPETVRPDSTPPVPPAITVYLTDDEPSSPQPSPSPPAVDQPLPSPPIETVTARRRRPSIETVELAGVPLVEDGHPRSGRHKRYRGPGAQGAWWKKEAHPAYSHEFADRRVIVTFPFPIRLEVIKTMMADHFSKYGAIRCVSHQDATPVAAEKAIVVFVDAASVETCFNDPERAHCVSRSNRNISNFDIGIERASSREMTRTIYIKLSGPRADSRARSASPPSAFKGEQPPAGDYRPLPEQISIWAFPHRLRRSSRVEWWARVAIGQSPEAFIIDKARAETGQEPVHLDNIDLRRRMPEKHIVPRLCDYFADLVDIVPPTDREQGWLICVSGQRDAERIMNEVGRIPGVTARWATESDGLDNRSTPDRSPRSPMGRFEKFTGGRVARAHRKFPRNLSLSLTTTTSHQTAPMTPPPSPPHGPIDLPSEYPHLRKLLAPTYRGRLLTEEKLGDGEVRYTDQSAVFVGRVVKEQESDASLFQRFAKYGPICAIEYKPENVRSTYATGRILFADPESAARAIRYESNAVSHGSSLKVELRRVLPQDVRMKEIYLDEIGRPISPSMVQQYSPPSLPLAPHAVEGPGLAPFPVHPGFPPQVALPSGQPDLSVHPNFWPVFVGAKEPPHLPLSGPMYVGPPGVGLPGYPNPNSPHPANLHNLGYMPIYPHYPSHLPSSLTPPPMARMMPRSPPPNISSMAPAHSPYPIPSQHTSSVPASAAVATPKTPEPPAQQFDREPLQSPAAPKIVGYKSENGVFKVVYDPDELKKYQANHGMTPDLTPISPTPHQIADCPGLDEQPLQRPHTSPGRSRPDGANQPVRRASLAPAPRVVPIPIPFVTQPGHHQASPQVSERRPEGGRSFGVPYQPRRGPGPLLPSGP